MISGNRIPNRAKLTTTNSIGKHYPKQRGIALVLVLVAVATAFIISLSFLNAQSTTASIARNVQNQTNARQIAESALMMAIEEVQTNASYRDVHPNGAWVTDLSLNGGVVTIVGEDGTDTDGDGVVDGDGDLTDDTSDPITLTVTATFDGAAHTVCAIISDSRKVSVDSIAVSDKIEVKDDGVIDSWNSTLGSYDSTKGSNAVVSTNSTTKEKIKIKDRGEIRGDAFVGVGGNPNQGIKIENSGNVTGTKDVLPNNLIIPGVAMPNFGGGDDDDDDDDDGGGSGVVNSGDFTLNNATDTFSSHKYFNKFKLEGSAMLTISGHVIIWVEDDVEIKDDAEIVILVDSSLLFYTGDEKKSFKVEKNARLNVLGEDPSRLTFYRSSAEKMEFKDDTQVYGTFVAPSAEVKIKDNARVFGSMRAKKLKIEGRAQFHLDLAPKFVDVDDVFIDLGGSDYGIAAETKIEIANRAQILQLGPDRVRISTNSADSDQIKYKDDSVTNGDFYVGVSGSPGVVIKDEGGTHNGTENILQHSVDILEIDVPTMPTSTGDKSLSGGKTTITTDQHWKKLELKDTAILEIDGDLNIMVDEDVKIEKTAQIQLKGNSTLNLYVGKKVEVKDTAQVNTDKANPDRMNIFLLTEGEELVSQDNAIVYAHVIAPYAKINLKSDSIWHGTIRCFEFKIDDDAVIHVPTGIGEGQGDVGTPSELKIQWIESP